MQNRLCGYAVCGLRTGAKKTHTQKRRGARGGEQKTHPCENQMRKDGAPSVFFGFELTGVPSLAAKCWHKTPEAHLGGFLSEFQKLGSMLCCAQRRRASSVVTKGFLLTCTRRDDPALSLWIMGEPPGMMASLGTRYRSPDPRST